jgi:hypothetical protein
MSQEAAAHIAPIPARREGCGPASSQCPANNPATDATQYFSHCLYVTAVNTDEQE